MQKKTLWAIVALVLAIIVIAAAFIVLTGAPPKKYSLELWYNSDGHYGDTEADLAAVLQQSIESCGKVDVTLRSDIWTVYKQNWVAQRMPLFLLGWYPDYFDSDNYVSPFLSIAGAASLGSFYNNSQVDQWITDQQVTEDSAIRADRMGKIQERLGQDVPYVPLFSDKAHVAYVNGLSNVELHPVSFKWFIIDKPGATELNASTTDRIISLDPASAYDYFSIEVINQVLDTLIVYEPVDAQLMPGLAQDVPTVANGLIRDNYTTFEFRLKPNIRFHDGTMLTSDMVKQSIDRVIRLDLPGSPAYLLYDVGGLTNNSAGGANTTAGVIDTPNPNTIIFHLFKSFPFFNHLMAFSVSAPVAPSYDQTGEQPSTVGNVIGTGPYELTTHTENQLIVLQKFANYHTPDLYATESIPTIPVEDTVNINIRATAAQLKADIETKAVDVAYRTLTPTDVTDLQPRATTLGLTVDIAASPFIRYLVFNVNKISDVRVRQAIAYSVDRARIDSVVFNGFTDPLYSMIPPNMPFSQPVFQTEYGSEPNCTQANALFTQLGYVIVWTRAHIARDI